MCVGALVFFCAYLTVVTYVRPISAALRANSAAICKVISYVRDKNDLVKGKMQLELNDNTFIKFLGKLDHFQALLKKKFQVGWVAQKKFNFQFLIRFHE